MIGRILGIAAILGSWAVPFDRAEAGFIPASASSGPAGLGVGTGLTGSFYDGGTATAMLSISAANAIIAAGSPTATFHATVIDYPRGSTTIISDATPLSTYLGADAASLSGAGASILDTSVFRYTGFINITSDLDQVAGNATIDVNFAVGSDDGMRLLIGGVNIAQYDGIRSFGVTVGVASFESPGLYAIDLLHFENHGTTGVELYSSIPGIFSPNVPAGTLALVPTSSLYSATAVPEPSSFALVGLGAAGLVLSRFRRR